MHKLCVYIPHDHLEPVKTALFTAGAGYQGEYSHCCWQTLGTGQFKPLSGSKPFIGEQDTLESVPEYRVEMLVPDDKVATVATALRLAHPYEVPAFDFTRVADV